MPTSQHMQISKIMDIIIKINPVSLLDVGIGFGKYGFLSREYLDLTDGRNQYSFKRRIDGVEIYEKYILPHHEEIYSNILVGDFKDLINNIEDNQYDLILLIDVIEHFSKTDAKYILNKILNKGRFVIISIPKDIGTQNECFGNIYETHKSQWNESDISSLGYNVRIKDSENYIFLLSKYEGKVDTYRNTIIKSIKNKLRKKRIIQIFWQKYRKLCPKRK